MIQMLKYLNGTCKDKLILSSENLNVIKWYLGAYFSVRPNFKRHTGGIMTLVGGSIQSISHKQNITNTIITKAELVGAKDASTMILWTWFFLEDQFYEIVYNIL